MDECFSCCGTGEDFGRWDYVCTECNGFGFVERKPDQFVNEFDAFDDEGEAEADVCADCGRIIHGEDVCCVCGAAMCFACFEMGAGVCKGPHKRG